MKWYYLIRGDVARHGIVEEEELARMAREGGLRRTDLVWNQAEGTCWVPANTLPGLFASAKPPSLVSAPAPPAPAPAGRKSRGRLLLALAVLIVALLALLALLWLRHA